MARFGRYKVSFNKGVGVGSVIGQLVGLVIGLWVLSQILVTLRSVMSIGTGTNSNDPLYSTWTFLGLAGNGINGFSSGLITIIGIILAAGIILRLIRIQRM